MKKITSGDRYRPGLRWNYFWVDMRYRYYAVPKNYFWGGRFFRLDYNFTRFTFADTFGENSGMVGQGHVDNASLVGRHRFQVKGVPLVLTFSAMRCANA